MPAKMFVKNVCILLRSVIVSKTMTFCFPYAMCDSKFSHKSGNILLQGNSRL